MFRFQYRTYIEILEIQITSKLSATWYVKGNIILTFLYHLTLKAIMWSGIVIMSFL